VWTNLLSAAFTVHRRKTLLLNVKVILCQNTSPDIPRIVCCDRVSDRPSGRPRVSDPATYCSSTARIQLPAVARYQSHLHGLATAIHETSGLDLNVQFDAPLLGRRGVGCSTGAGLDFAGFFGGRAGISPLSARRRAPSAERIQALLFHSSPILATTRRKINGHRRSSWQILEEPEEIVV